MRCVTGDGCSTVIGIGPRKVESGPHTNCRFCCETKFAHKKLIGDLTAGLTLRLSSGLHSDYSCSSQFRNGVPLHFLNKMLIGNFIARLLRFVWDWALSSEVAIGPSPLQKINIAVKCLIRDAMFQMEMSTAHCIKCAKTLRQI